LQLVEHSFHFDRFRLWRRDDQVSPIQKLEVRQLTRAMWTVLRYAKHVHPIARYPARLYARRELSNGAGFCL
jgi:hypothetical protein